METVDPYVQNGVAGTCGNLYLPLVGKLPRYPIPHFPVAPRGPLDLLDVGCGWGRWTIAAARRGYLTVGVDPDAQAVEAARRIATQVGVTSDFVVGDAADLPFEDATFDFVFSYSVLQHLPDEAVLAAFHEIHRVLRPGGRALIELPNRFGLWNAVRRLRLPDAPMRYRTPAEMLELGRIVGASRLLADSFLSLNAQPADADILPLSGRAVVLASRGLLRLASVVRPARLLADSLYVHADRL